MTGELICKQKIDGQAKQDARDAYAGHAVYNPYPQVHDGHAVWQKSYECYVAMMYKNDCEIT